MPGLKFYFDEDSLDHDVVAALRTRGLDVITAIDARLIGRRDEEHFAFSAREQRVLYTANVGDFARLLAAALARQGTHPGIVVRTWQRMPVGYQVRGLVALDATATPADVRDRVTYLAAFVD